MEESYLNELCERASRRFVTFYSKFLNLAEQKEAEIAAKKSGCFYLLFGGSGDCERKMLGVSSSEEPDPLLFPIQCLRVSPKSARFSSPISHRDVLGSFMGLGIERELLGDIAVRPDGIFVFCTDKMAAFISQSLIKVGNTDVSCEFCDPPQGSLRQIKEVRLQVASPRADAVAAHLFKLSRGDAQTLFRQGKIMVDDAECSRSDYILKEGQVLSVRGFGRCRYMGVESISKKGKNNLLIHLYS